MENVILLTKIQAFYEKKRRMPTVRETMSLIRTRSMKQTTALIEGLVESGAIERDKNGKRYNL
jgi:SOS-response transcriptional repressor LexA